MLHVRNFDTHRTSMPGFRFPLIPECPRVTFSDEFHRKFSVNPVRLSRTPLNER
jgi:hypothetical protein